MSNTGTVKSTKPAPPKKTGEERRNGSTLVGLLAAGLLLGAAISLIGLAQHWWSLPAELKHVAPLQAELWIDAICCVLFALVLFWWAASGPSGLRMFVAGRGWGIGNPTVSMVITIVAAVVAIVAFTHELLKPEQPKSAPTVSHVAAPKK